MAYYVTQGNWAKVVKSRDGNRCIYCGSTEKLETHHIKSRAKFPDDVLDIENGVTLCHKCHYTAHAGNYTTYQLAWRDSGLSCVPLEMRDYILRYAETIKGYVPPSDINKLTISGDTLSVAVGAARRAGDKGATAFIRRAVETTAAREFSDWRKEQDYMAVRDYLQNNAVFPSKKEHKASFQVAISSYGYWAARTDHLRALRESARASAGIPSPEQAAPGNSGDLPPEQAGPKTLGD